MICLLCFYIFVILKPQEEKTVIVTGYVKDALTKQGVEGATVIIGKEWTHTDTNGKYEIRGVPVGENMLNSYKPGSYWYDSKITIRKGNNILEDILLSYPEKGEGVGHSDARPETD